MVLATDKNDRARSRFDGAHELGHLVMHGEHVWGLKQVESQAHAFAAAFLMPDRDIRDELPSYADWPTESDLRRPVAGLLAALLLRAKNLGRMTDASYLTAVKALSARGWRRQEPIPIGPPENPARLLQIVGANGGNGVSKAIPRQTEQPGRWPVPAPFGGPRGQHGSSTTSGNYGNQPGTTGIAPSR